MNISYGGVKYGDRWMEVDSGSEDADEYVDECCYDGSADICY